MRISFASSPFPVSVDACRGSGDWSWCFWVVQVFLPVERRILELKIFCIWHFHVFQFVHVHVSCLVCDVRLFFCCSRRYSFPRVAMDFMFVFCHHAVSVGTAASSTNSSTKIKGTRIRMYLCSLVGCLCDVVLNGVCRAVLKVVRRSMFNQYSASNSSQEISQNTAASILRHFLEGF